MNYNKKRTGYCRDMARKILKETALKSAPIDVNKIADYYKLKVVLLDQPADKFSGILHREKKAIGINKNHHPVRQRFSLAHELGHYFLDHPTYEEILPDEEGEKEYKVYESEADEFAAELLVPIQLLKRGLSEKLDIEALLKRFKVSRHVLIIQLTKHNLLMKM